MESFTIACTTCQKRLKVRDASAVGEILICPSCGSMVLVEHPEGSAAQPAAEVTGTEADTREDFGYVLGDMQSAATSPPEDADDSEHPEAPPVAEAPPVTEAPDGSPIPPPTALNATPPPAVAPPSPTASPPQDTTEAQPPFSERVEMGESLDDDQPLSQPAGSPVLPTDEWTSPAALRRQQWLMVGGAALAGILLALALVGLLAYWGGYGSEVDDSDSVGAVSDEPPEPPEDLATGDTADQPDESADDATGPSKRPTDPPNAEDTSGVKPDGTKQPGAKQEGEASQESQVDPETQVDSSAEPQPPREDSTAKPGEAPAEPADDTTDSETAAPNGDTKSATSDPLVKTLDNFAPFMQPDSFIVPPPKDTNDAALPSDVPDLPDDDSAPRPEAREIDVARRLKDKIRQIEFQDVPLKLFLRFVTDFSTIPISLDPDAVALVNASPRSPVSVSLENTTVDALLDAAVHPLNLSAVVVQEQILVTRPPFPDDQLTGRKLPADDLVGQDLLKLTELADLITLMVAPKSWQGLGGSGSIRESPPALVIYQQDTVLYRCFRFCDRLRAARGLPFRSSFDPALFDLAPRWSLATDVLNKPISLNFAAPTPFVDVLDRLGQETGGEIIIDWIALGDLGWTPDTETTLAANEQPLGDALRELLRPMGLTYRVIAKDTLQITTPTVIDSELDIDFYAVAEDVESPETHFLQQVGRLGEGVLEQVGGALHWDAPSRHMIVALPQPHQRELARLLAEGG